MAKLHRHGWVAAVALAASAGLGVDASGQTDTSSTSTQTVAPPPLPLSEPEAPPPPEPDPVPTPDPIVPPPPQDAVEEITVTGSYIRRKDQLEQPLPIAVYGSEQLEAIGAKQISDLTRTLTINTGAENNVDAFTQNASEGTSNINLRGLGVGSTLVLLNSHRQTTVGIQTNQGISFVDTSALVPLIAIDRVEILKDGASALYGSDAVAGVANFLTRSDFSGVELSTDYQLLTDGLANQFLIQGISGIQGDKGGVVAAFSYLNQEELTTEERRLSAFGIDDTSAIGSPGTFFFIGLPGTTAPVPIIDPRCAEFGGIPAVARPNAIGPGLDAGTCNFDFGRYYQIVPKEERINAYLESHYELFTGVRWRGEATFSTNSAERKASPSFAILTFPVIPSDHPNDPFPDQLDPFPRAYFGRLVGHNGEAQVQPSRSNTYRVYTGLDGKVGGVFYDAGYTYSRNDRTFSTLDHLTQRVQLALNGLGGPGCNPLTGTPGEGNCQYLNPFSSSRDEAPNSPELMEWLTSRQVNAARSDLHVIDAVFSTELFDLDAISMAVALGWQYRRAEESVDWNDQSNDRDFVFVIGNADYSGIVDTTAVFVETSFTFLERIHLQLAGRYETYFGDVGSSFDPKVALMARPIDWLALRGSFSTSFKAPTVFQGEGGTTTLQDVIDPLSGARAFVGVTSSGNPALEPEQSINYNFGVTARPFEGFSADLDFWSFHFSDVITPENAQAKLNADPQNPAVIIRAGDPINGPILRILTDFVNANEVVTRGLDLTAQYRWPTPAGMFIPVLAGTYVLQYDLQDPNIGKVKGAGSRNFANFGTSVPQLRFNAGLSWLLDAHSANVFVRYIGSYDDDANLDDEMKPVRIDSQTTLDLQYSLSIGSYLFDSNLLLLTLGCNNLFDAAPPHVTTNGGYDSKVHDPRGRLFYASLKVGF